MPAVVCRISARVPPAEHRLWRRFAITTLWGTMPWPNIFNIYKYIYIQHYTTVEAVWDSPLKQFQPSELRGRSHHGSPVEPAAGWKAQNLRHLAVEWDGKALPRHGFVQFKQENQSNDVTLWEWNKFQTLNILSQWYEVSCNARTKYSPASRAFRSLRAPLHAANPAIILEEQSFRVFRSWPKGCSCNPRARNSEAAQVLTSLQCN